MKFYIKRFIFSLIIISSAINIFAQEMQLSGGFEAGFGIFKVNNDFWYNYGVLNYHINENTQSSFFALGISLSVRIFPDTDNFVSTGFIFRDRAIFMTNIKQTGTVSINNVPQPVSETFTLSDDLFISIMDYDMGVSFRYKISNGFRLYADLGLNFTIMDSEDFKTSDTFNYLGFGIFTGVAFQLNLKETLYLEFGVNSINNIFSGQEGTYHTSNIKVNYEDSGRWDLTSVAAYIHFGVRFDLKKIWNR
jgi:hypothetical protein